eukprot:TRINITY_DN9973_c0_g1_i1.p1 TRINITY_DN9973_c0_g1~~TRINITY_DN9973_c0_g1_i1.p1  ORF type:complete len:107 (+),score=15.00 TRINITY_DN9973_c0_g1_i1:807-1127(+)
MSLSSFSRKSNYFDCSTKGSLKVKIKYLEKECSVNSFTLLPFENLKTIVSYLDDVSYFGLRHTNVKFFYQDFGLNFKIHHRNFKYNLEVKSGKVQPQALHKFQIPK